MKILLTGNEAIARGAYEAGVHIATGYPGTPSTEILENLGTYEGVRTEWAPNEKVALEEAAGASIVGARTLVTMKHVGLNVAADPLFTMAYTGINGGLVIVVCDEPGMFSSQNEQDSRHYASHAKVMMLEPSNSQECIDIMKDAYELSEAHDTLVIVRLTTRVSHSKSPVELNPRVEVPIRDYTKDISKYIMLPAMGKVKHLEMETKRIPAMRAASNASPLNPITYNDRSLGIIANGMAYNYAEEVFGENASYLKMGFTYPMPDAKIKEFAKNVDRIIVIEENEPYMENYIRALGIECTGKDVLPLCGEFSPQLLREKLLDQKAQESAQVDAALPNRPPALCAGCPHRGFFYTIKKLGQKAVVSTDIGCYTLGASAPMLVGDTCICMGAGFSAGVGMSRAMDIAGRSDQRVFGILGDSTFFHSGMTGLVDMVYSNANMVAVILDNSITAMTGHQENPGSGKSLNGEIAQKVSIDKIVEAVGFVKGENFAVCDGYNLKEMDRVIKDAMSKTGPYVIIIRRECVLIKEVIQKRKNMRCIVNADKCISCRKCLEVSCPAVTFPNIETERRPKMVIDQSQCVGCATCKQVCPTDAIEMKGVKK